MPESDWHVYLVEEEDTGAHYHVVASSPEEAEDTARADSDLDGDATVRLRDPSARFAVAFVDGCDYDGEARDFAQSGFHVYGNSDAPTVSGTFAQWANKYQTPMVIACNEW